MGEVTGTEDPTDGSGLISWGVAERSSPGETICGDRYLVKPFANGVLVAIVDGLGHGQEAATAAQRAITTLENYVRTSAIGLITRCHQELRHSRGAVMGLASYNGIDDTMTWLGVGNVQGILHRAHGSEGGSIERLSMCRGVVGYQLPALRAEVMPVRAGDTLIVATDGIRGEFTEKLSAPGSPQEVAESILAQYAKGMDDALVLAARYIGVAHDGGAGRSLGTV
jgi:phosphoserine phosphatase RsbX